MKNLFKKIGALLVAAVMVLSMCTAVFAADGDVFITVNDENGNQLTGATLKYLQVIAQDRTTETGWKFVNNAGTAYKTAFHVGDDQLAIKKLIEAQNPGTYMDEEGNPTVIKATSTEIAAALNSLTITAGMANPQKVTEAGVYAISATQSNYTYSNMAAYVGFAAENYPTLESTTVTAKRSSTNVTKDVVNDESDHVVAINDIVRYQIKAFVPAFAPTDTNKLFKITDELTGAEYVKLNGTDKTATVKMKKGNNEIDLTDEVTFTETQNGGKKGFEVNLSDLTITDDNRYVGYEVTIEYDAQIKDVTTNNTAKGHIGNSKSSSVPVELYTGKVEVVKVDAKNTNTKLSGAEFIVYRTLDNENKEYAVLLNGKFDHWTTVEADATKITTDTNGHAQIEGLNVGTYWFKEVKAPEGYSKNIDPVSVTLTQEGVADKVVTATPATMKDTKLSSLPSTGGMGTYLFTIIGVVVMAGAAGAFFISRRKGSEE
ncbi:SpaH/EbpB family LPXTG-anchored major pilin [Blautia massiliensis (ex Durand et al. 2017)]|uniref:SpaH/EbpB family LPXTG-anchored major pilin n=1 Tax=Blautia massiliensis (ex Durand et al. 2017) TaxID=1737424 RepID=UPI00242ED19E|nr:SpaH/EbpB family LPXTG-anchored major pilin [Blautia massiliensis (ex Durand et al. 2017)]